MGVVDTGAAITSYDLFAEAISEAEGVGAKVTFLVANPADVLTLAKLKTGNGSNEPML